MDKILVEIFSKEDDYLIGFQRFDTQDEADSWIAEYNLNHYSSYAE
jgi:hypothetical protein